MHGVVFDRLRPAPEGRGTRPPGLGRWGNLADAGDIFAVPRELRERFDGIDAHPPDLRVGGWDFHTARNHLACKETMLIVHSGWTGIEAMRSI